jgi:lysine/ornithine N-monooxygenase
MANLKCPICNSNLIYHRINDGESKVEIINEEEIEEISNESDGSTSVYCSSDESHTIPQDLQFQVIEIAEGFGY